MAKQYGGERATYDNKFIIVKGGLSKSRMGKLGPHPAGAVLKKNSAPNELARYAGLRAGIAGTVRERRVARPRPPLAGNPGRAGRGLATRRAEFFLRINRPGCPVPRFAEFPAVLPLPDRKKNALASVCFVKRNGADLFPALSLFSCKAAVVSAGLTAEGGKGGARPRRGGA